MSSEQPTSSWNDLLHGGSDPISDPAKRSSAGRLAMALFIISLAMVFATVVLAYIVVRMQLAQEGG